MEPNSQPAECPNCHSDDPRVIPIVDSGGLCRDKWHHNWSPASSEPGESAEQRIKTKREWVERVRKNLHDTYNGGHHEEPAHGAFHHGMDTVCNVLASSSGWLPEELVRAQLQESERERDDMTSLAQSYLHKIRALEADAKANTEWKRVAGEREREFERGYASGQAAWEDAHTESCDAALAERDKRIQRLREKVSKLIEGLPNYSASSSMYQRVEAVKAALKEDSK